MGLKSSVRHQTVDTDTIYDVSGSYQSELLER